MNSTTEKIVFTVAIVLMFCVFLFILFGEKGLLDLKRLGREKQALIQKNENLSRQNLIMYQRIERLKKDPAYIESVARKDFGMVGKDEIVVKLKPGGEPSP